MLREKGKSSASCLPMLAICVAPLPRPSRAPPIDTARSPAADCDIFSRECSRSACAISWPITAAISSSVSFSLRIRPV